MEGAIGILNNLTGLLGTGFAIYDFFKDKKNDFNAEMILAIQKKSEKAYEYYCEIRKYKANFIGQPIKSDVINYWESCLRRNMLPSVEDIVACEIADREEAQLLFCLLVESWIESPVYIQWINCLITTKTSLEISKQLSYILEEVNLIRSIPEKIEDSLTSSGLVTCITKERITKAQEDCTQKDIKHYFTVDNRFETMLRVISSKKDIPHEEALKQLLYLLENEKNVIISGNGGQGKTSLMLSAAIQMTYKGYIVLWMSLSANYMISEQKAGLFFDTISNCIPKYKKIILCIDNPFEGVKSFINLRERWPSNLNIQIIMAERLNRLSLLADVENDALLYWFDKAKMVILQGISELTSAYSLKNYETFPFAESAVRRNEILKKAISEFTFSEKENEITNEVGFLVESVIKKYTHPKVSLVETIYSVAFELQSQISKSSKIKLDWNEWGDFIRREFKNLENESDIGLYSYIAASKYFGIALPVSTYCRFYELLDIKFKNRLKERMIGLHVEPIIYNQSADTIQPKHDVIAELFFRFNKGKVNINETMISMVGIMDENELELLLSHMVDKGSINNRINQTIGELDYWTYFDTIYKRIEKEKLVLAGKSKVYLCLGFLWANTNMNSKENIVKVEEVLNKYAPKVDGNILTEILYTEWGIWANRIVKNNALAEKKLRIVVEMNNRAIQSRTELGRVLSEQKGRELDAEKYFIEAIKIDPLNLPPRTELGKLLSKQNGREEEAEKYLLEVLRIDHLNIMARTELGKLLSKQKHREIQAEKYLLEVLEIDPFNIMARTELGRLLSAQKDREKEAERYLLEVLEIDSFNFMARTELGRLFSKQKDREKEAEKFLLEAIKINPVNVPTFTELGRLLSKQKSRNKDAEKYLLKAIEIDPANLHPRTELGILLSKQRGQEARAEKYLLEVIKINPMDIIARTELGRLLTKQKGREEEAEKHLLEAIRIDPSNSIARTELGRHLSKQRRRAREAEKYLLEVLEIEPQNVIARTDLGRLWSKQKDREGDAEKLLIEVLIIEPKSIIARIELGRLLSKQKGREKEAEEYLLEAIKIDPMNLPPHTELGRLLSRQEGREAEAEKYLLEAIKIDPMNLPPHTELGRLLSRQEGREAEAEKYLLKAIKLDPMNVPPHTELGKLLSRQKGREAEAEKYFLENIKLDPHNVISHIELGRLLTKQNGREAEAEKYLLEAIKTAPLNLYARTSLGNLYETYDRKKALKVYQEICVIDPNNRYGLNGLKRLNENILH
ncbi:MAG: tetratricopeptide repeat protein [Candidatus Pacebacteria bacterium]|nr:tetratricopeptide repeat protein [Candidatus Paceibacterota bacterium]